jgi:dephospho-CoA kinase
MIIGISGKIGSGKDTLAQMIMEQDPTFTAHKFADKLKQIAILLTGFHDQWSREGKNIFLEPWSMTVGELQQRLGTEAIRNGLHPRAWILALFADYCPKLNWIITDVRFPNEVLAILGYGGILVRLNGREVIEGRDRNHLSETALDGYGRFDVVVDNSGSLDKLRSYVPDILNLVYSKQRNKYG